MLSPCSSALKKDVLAGCTVVYRNKSDFDATFAMIVAKGKNKLHVISDFDFTLTKYYQEDGSRSASCHMVLEHSVGLLPDSYCTGAKFLQQKYHPIEVDPHMDYAVKFQHMEDWVLAHNKLFMESGLTQNIIDIAVTRALESKHFRIRPRVSELISMLETNQVPLLIFSAGITNVLENALQKDLLVNSLSSSLPSNVNIISNKCLFDLKDGSLTGFSEPVLHVYNKTCHAFVETNPHFKILDKDQRRNVLLFGDSLGDIKMSQGIEDKIDHIIKVGFVNDKTVDIGDSRLETFLALNNYDLVVLGDPGMDVQIYLLNQVLSMCKNNL